MGKSSQTKRQNEALDVIFLQKYLSHGHPRSRVTEKSQISNFINSIQLFEPQLNPLVPDVR